jgi:polyprenyl-phospho-N-acetylgalactosaminyl synthase
MDYKIFCVIPAFNEEKTIGDVIKSIKPYVDMIVVVNDGSKDQTEKIAKNNNAVVISHLINRGQGASLETGDVYAIKKGADIIIHFDADGQFNAKEIPEGLKLIIEDKFEAVLGSRFLGKETNMPFIKKNIMFPIARIVNRIFFGIKLTDPQCGFRILSRTAAEKITIEQAGWAHCTEILTKIIKNNIKYKEVPITVTYNKFGNNLDGGFQILRDLIISKFLN